MRARRKCGAGTSLNVDVDQDEPGLIQATKEVLQEGDVPERDRAALINTTPIPERIARIGEDRFVLFRD
jgi:hypothetical protein